MKYSKSDPDFNSMIETQYLDYFEKLVEETEAVSLARLPASIDKKAIIKSKVAAQLEKFKDQIITESENISKGFKLINEWLPQFLSQKEIDKVNKECRIAGEKILAEDLSGINSEENEATFNTPQEIGISEETMAIFYKISRLLYEQERFEECKNTLSIITFLDPSTGTYWLAQGFVLHKLHRYDEAIKSYTTASELDPDDPEPLYYTAIAFSDMNDSFNAHSTFDRLTHLIANLHYPGEWKTKMSNLKQKIFTNK